MVPVRRPLPRLGRAWIAIATAATVGCGSPSHRYPLRDPLWVDADQQPFGPRPAELYHPWAWDGADNTVFRQLSELWLYEEPRPAINVNSVDEVPSSSWFQNRIGRRALSASEAARGACATLEPPPTPWTVVAPKPNGSSPGLVIEAADGQRYLFKVDGDLGSERPTAADAIATRMFHAAGYFTPCNHVVFVTPRSFRIARDARRAVGSDEPMRPVDVEAVLERAHPEPDGRLRGSVSRYLDGAPLGGWAFEGRREDDPNDVVPHQHRREVRAMSVLSAWLNHVDSRAENNLDMWVSVDGRRGFVRHFVLDVGDSFGVIWPRSDALTRRLGHAHYVDLEHMMGELFSLGLIDRPYHHLGLEDRHPVFGYYEVATFEPDQWRNGYPNPGYERLTEHDAAWMARIIARFDDASLEAMVAAGRFADPRTEAELLAILRGRQRRILERYLTRLSPLTLPEVRHTDDGARLCLRDLAVETHTRSARSRHYEAHAELDWPAPDGPRLRLVPSVDGAEVCVPLPSSPDTSVERPRYTVVRIVASSFERETTGPVEVHLYQTGPVHRVVGLRRGEPV